VPVRIPIEVPIADVDQAVEALPARCVEDIHLSPDQEPALRSGDRRHVSIERLRIAAQSALQSKLASTFDRIQTGDFRVSEDAATRGGSDKHAELWRAIYRVQLTYSPPFASCASKVQVEDGPVSALSAGSVAGVVCAQHTTERTSAINVSFICDFLFT
jgi:hypothetical protein